MGANCEATMMEVGPSAAPMMPMEAASLSVKRNTPRSSTAKRMAAITVKKMPNCAAAPKNIILGVANRGRKSVIAPMPTKISAGNSSVVMPKSLIVLSRPPVPSVGQITESGRFTSIAPMPMGSSSMGS